MPAGFAAAPAPASLAAEVLSPADLSPARLALWRQLQAADPDLASPFFAPDFARLVARFRPDARVAVLIRGGAEAGFFPFHRRPLGRGVAIGGQISDYHGVIGPAELAADAPALLRAAGLAAFDFNHALPAQTAFAARAFRHAASPLVDLGAGFAAWRADRDRATSALKTLDRRLRKLEREMGPLRFTPRDPDPAAWARFLDWKRAALAAEGVGLILDRPWVRALAEAIRDTDTPDFAGMFSTLRAGEHLVAAHFGMRSARAWHWWFPAYDEAAARHSPGLALLLACVRHAAGTGLAELDLGRGSQRYKTEFANRARPVCEGALARPLTLAGAARRLRHGAQGLADRWLPPRGADLARRAGNRLLSAGRL
jgi:CelD/BcsL family acetyltransferase involved in cellulose biosynthesis